MKTFIKQNSDLCIFGAGVRVEYDLQDLVRNDVLLTFYYVQYVNNRRISCVSLGSGQSHVFKTADGSQTQRFWIYSDTFDGQRYTNCVPSQRSGSVSLRLFYLDHDQQREWCCCSQVIWVGEVAGDDPPMYLREKGLAIIILSIYLFLCNIIISRHNKLLGSARR